MNMISQLRQRVRHAGKAEITAAEYDQLQAEWITRGGIETDLAAVEQEAQEPVGHVASNGDVALPILRWVSADRALKTPIGTALYTRPQAASGWQPIATAPKDGTEVTVSHAEGGVCSAFHDAGSWYCMDGCTHQVARFTYPPDFWQPHPAAPEPQS